MRKRWVSIVLLLGLITILLLGTVMPIAKGQVVEGSEVIPNITEQLGIGWERVSPTTTVYTSSEVVDGNVATSVRVSAAPMTLDDNKTLIDTKWYLQSDPSGQKWFESGNNVYKSRVTANKISVLDGKGRLADYNSALSVESNTYKGGMPYIVDDPLTGQRESCLVWDYGKYGKKSTLTRYLRSNNGRLSELWVLTGPPTKNLVFRPNITQEDAYGAAVTPMMAFDAEYHIIPMTSNLSKGFYVIDVDDLANAVYPIYIDPTYDFASLEDAWLTNSNAVYSTARSAASAYYVVNGDYPAWVGQDYYISTYYVNRSTLTFNTATVPSNLTITEAYAGVYGYQDQSTTDFNLYFCSGQPTYPHYPTVAADFNRTYYTVDSGSGYSTTSGWPAEYLALTLNNLGWIVKGGTTKLMLMSSRDIVGTSPVGAEKVSFWQAEHGASYMPWLHIEGTVPVVVPTVTTNPASSITSSGAMLNGYISNDGGASCSVQFQYGTTTAYGLTTAWVSGYSTGSTFNTAIAGLAPGTVYHYRAVASNTAGTGYGADSSFTAAPLAPTFFTATGGNAQVSLAWTVGTGAYKTLVMRKTGSYPTSVVDGTMVYYNTGTNIVDSPLVNGTLYFYGAWSFAADTITYSLTSVQSSATPAALGAPSVVTGSASNVTTNSATLQGNLTGLGGYASADVHFEYGIVPAWTDSTAPQTLTATGVFSANIGSLTPASPYQFKAVAVGTGGTTYGSDGTFTTSGNSAPVMTTNAATGVQINAAQLNGTVTSDGGSPPVTVWFEYGLTTQYELGVTPTAAGLITSDTYYYGLGGLATNTTYHYRAVGQNTLGTTYGADAFFATTLATAPTATTNVATNVGAVQATLQGTLITDGGASCALSFDWGPTIGYGSTITATPATGTAGTIYSALLTGLSTGVTYHYRAVSVNNGGTGSGTDLTFTTVFGPPTNFAAVAVSSSTINLSWVLQGDQTYVTYKTTGYPVDRSDGTQIYFGLSTYATLSGLSPGTTYYFSAWSWKVGDVWTTANANAIATTYASNSTNQFPTPTVAPGSEPTTPNSWFDIPDNAIIKNLPLYTVLTGWATAYEVPESTFWMFISLLSSVLAGALVFVAFKQAPAAIGASVLVTILAGLLHACPPILAMFIATIEIGAGYGVMSLGGNVTGRSA